MEKLVKANFDNSIIIKISNTVGMISEHQIQNLVKNELINLKNKVFIDLEDVSFIDSTGIKLIIDLYQELTKLDKQMYIINANSTIKEVCKVMNLNKLISIK